MRAHGIADISRMNGYRRRPSMETRRRGPRHLRTQIGGDWTVRLAFREADNEPGSGVSRLVGDLAPVGLGEESDDPQAEAD